MQLKDTKDTYGWVSIGLHWAVVGLLVAQYIIAGGMEDGTDASERAARGLHVSVGLIAFVLVFTRIFWRVKSGEKPLASTYPVLDFLARFVPRLLLITTGVLVLSGPLMVWSKGFGVRFFDLFVIPTPLPKIEWLHELLEEVHEIAISVIIGLLILHVLGAVRHLILDRDGVFTRILWPKK